MLVVTPFHPSDADQALRMFHWICEMEGRHRQLPHDLLLVADSRCSAEVVTEISDAAHQAFRAVEVLPFTDHFRKWPEAPNAVFAFVARQIMSHRKTPWLFLEPDCCPLKAGWLDTIEAEYTAAVSSGKHFMGARVEVEGVPLHMSGNGVYPANMFAHAGYALIANDIAWDVAAADQIVPQAHFTKLIEHSWKRSHDTKQPLNVSFESWEQVEREISKEAVLYHASKDGSLIERLRERKNNLSGRCETRTGEATREIAVHADCLPATTPNKSAAVRIRPAQTPVTDILIKSYPPDYEWLHYCIRAIQRFARGFRQIVLIVPEAPDGSRESIGLFAHEIIKDWIPAEPDPVKIRVVEIKETGEGYLFQQVVKASAHEYTDADYILHVDSDCIFKQPVTPDTFMRNGKPLWLMTPYDKIEVPWKAITERFLGEPIEYEFMRRLPIMMPRDLHVATAKFCEVKHKMRLTDYILSQPNREFSEFNALGALAYTRARDEFEWLDTTKEELPEPVALQFWSHDKITPEIRAQIEEVLKFEDILKGNNHDITASNRIDNTQHHSIDGDNSPDRDENRGQRLNPNIRQTKEGMWVLANDTHISRWVEEHGSLQHDFHTLPKVLEEIQPGDTVVDVGAFIGDTTTPFLERVGDAGTVYAFEPNGDAFECLLRNCPRAVSFMDALGEVGGRRELVPADNVGARHLRLSDGYAPETSMIKVETLDSFEFDRCDFIKIDVEGYELNVLRGAEHTINRFHPKLLIEVNHAALQRQGVDYSDLSNWLHDHGYTWEIVQKDDCDFDSAQFDILCKWIGKPAFRIGFDPGVGESETVYPRPWQSPLESLNEIRSLASRLQKFCDAPAHTNKVRQELHSAGVIPALKRAKKRRKRA